LSTIDRIRSYGEVIRLTPYDTSTEYGRSKERYRLIALSSFTSIFAKLITSLLGLITVPLTVNYLGKEQFGLWMVVSSLIVWMQLADFGISNGLTNALAEAHGRDDRETATSYVSTAFVATTLIALICLGPVIALAYFLPWESILNLQSLALKPMVINCFILAGLMFVLNLPLAIVNRIFIAYQLSYVVNLTQIVSSLVALLGLILAVKLKLSLPMLVLLISVGPLVGNVIAWIMLKRKTPWLSIGIRTVSWPAFRRVANSSVPMFVYLAGSMLTCQLVNVIIAQVGSLSMVADYNILWKIYLMIFTLGVSFSTPFYAAIREAFERKEADWVAKSITRALKIRLAVILSPALFLVFYGDWIIKIWVKKQLESPFGLYGWLLFFGCMILYTLYSTLSEILVSLDRIWAQNFLLISSSIIALVGHYLFIPIIGLKAYYLVSSVTIVIPIVYSICSVKLIVNKLKDSIYG